MKHSRIVSTFFFVFLISTFALCAKPIHVVVWDERQDAQTNAYGSHLGDALAAYLASQPGLEVKSVGLNDPDQGLSEGVLSNCDVLIWWGHQKHALVDDAHVAYVTERIKSGKTGLIALHSAHWSKPFIAAMEERTREDAMKIVPRSERKTIKVVEVPAKHGLTTAKDATSPSYKLVKGDDGQDSLEIHLPSCVFSYVKAEGKPSHLTTLLPKHPIAKGVPASFDIPQTEEYSGDFTVPKPDATVFTEQWDNGHTFTSGCAWKVGKGRVFYFRPGHEIYPIFKQEVPLKIVVNAIHWVKP